MIANLAARTLTGLLEDLVEVKEKRDAIEKRMTLSVNWSMKSKKKSVMNKMW